MDIILVPIEQLLTEKLYSPDKSCYEIVDSLRY